MAPGLALKFHARDVEMCWRIARAAAEGAQKRLNTLHAAEGDTIRARECKAARDTADRIALEIRFGRRRKNTKGVH